MERVGIRDFIDICYSYAINSPEMRHDFRSAFSSYAWGYKLKDDEQDMTFGGFEKQSLSMLDELDSFTLELA